MKTKPFNSEKALAGEPVVTRSGIRVTQLTKFTGLKDYYYSMIGVTEKGELLYCKENGRQSSEIEIESDLDLFMLCEEKEYWIATGMTTRSKSLISSSLKTTELLAIMDVRNNSEYLDGSTLQTHKIIRYE